MENHHETPVLVVGAGPAGLIAALQLAVNGVPCMLVEQNLDTTKWPKMDITNCRSMEILKRLGVAEGLREVGAPPQYSFDVNFSTGLSPGGQLVTKWDLPSPNSWRERIRLNNDGSMPSEPPQRCSQAIFEAWLKPHIQAQPLITSIFGWTLQRLGVVESDTDVVSMFVDTEGDKHTVMSKYVVGCDGAGSRVRRSIRVELSGGPVPMAMFLIHFRSRDLDKLHSQGQFWHIFFTSGAVIISQDEVETWTIHIPVPIGTDVSNMDPYDAIYRGLGGHFEPYHIKVDEILVKSIWRPNIYLADRYISPQQRVFLSGDAAHQNIPTGGYGMNTAVGDSFDIGWKIAAVLAGYGGPALLQSYEEERRPVAAQNIERSRVHTDVHFHYYPWFQGGQMPLTGPEWEEVKQKTSDWLREHDGENKDLGIELGYRYQDSSVIFHERTATAPPWSPSTYVPSTWPGVRAPHVYLKDGKTSIFDHFGAGQEYTLIDFTETRAHFTHFRLAAARLGLPLKLVHLPNEDHVRRVWERDAVLVRPDEHIAWRASETGEPLSSSEVEEVLMVVLGRKASKQTNGHISGHEH